MKACELLDNIRGRDSIEDHELMLLRASEHLDDIEANLMTVKEETMIEVDREYLQKVTDGDKAGIALLSTPDRRDAETKRRLAVNVEFMALVEERVEIELGLKIGRIQLDQMRRSFHAHLPAIQHVTRLKAEKIYTVDEEGNLLNRGTPASENVDTQAVFIDEFFGSIKDVLTFMEAATGQGTAENEPDKQSENEKKGKKVTEPSDVQYC